MEKIVSQENEIFDILGECLGFKDSQKFDSISIEVRAAAGGEEAGLFSLELAKIYQRYISN